jgi:ABC-type transport system substrate-binding protein
MRSRAVRVAVLVVAGSALSAACTSAASSPAQPPAAPTVTTAESAPVTTTTAATPTLATTAAATTSASGAVAFFRAQEAGCAQHAAATGNPPVEPARFAGATQVRDLGGGSYLVRDGRGTELVVQPAKGVVLPASGKAADEMPSPYGVGCSEKVFLGSSD